MKCCDFFRENLDNVKMNHSDYYDKKRKEQKNGKEI